MRTMALRWSLVAGLTVAASGCATATSRPVPPNSASSTVCPIDRDGIIYFLPKRLLKVSFASAPVDLAADRAAVEASRKAVEDATLVVQTVKSALAAKRAQRIEAVAAAAQASVLAKIDAEIADLEKRGPDAMLRLAKEAERLSEKSTALAESMKIGQGNQKETLTVEVLPPVADTSRAYYLTMDHWANRDDAMTVETTEAGLLKSVNSTSKDRTGDIIASLAKSVVQFARLGASRPKALEVDERAEARPAAFVKILDPFDDDARKELDVRLKPVGMTLNLTPVAGANNLETAEPRTTSGILYRRSVPYTLSVGDEKLPTQSAVVLLPNMGPIGALDFRGGLFTEAKGSVAFIDGSPVKVEQGRPSELAGFLGIVPGVLSDLVSIPAEIFKVQIGETNAAADLLKAQKAYLDALAALHPSAASTPEAAE